MIKLPPMFSLPRLSHFFLILIFTACSASALAKDSVSIENAWVRATPPGQNVGAGFMTFTSQQDVTLISATSDVSKSIEIHSMSMQNGVMKMRMLENLAIKANKPYKLEPGGFHLMLFDLEKPLTAGDYVNFELTFKTGTTEFKQKIKAQIKVSADVQNDDHSHHHH